MIEERLGVMPDTLIEHVTTWLNLQQTVTIDDINPQI